MVGLLGFCRGVRLSLILIFNSESWVFNVRGHARKLEKQGTTFCRTSRGAAIITLKMGISVRSSGSEFGGQVAVILHEYFAQL